MTFIELVRQAVHESSYVVAVHLSSNPRCTDTVFVEVNLKSLNGVARRTVLKMFRDAGKEIGASVHLTKPWGAESLVFVDNLPRTEIVDAKNTDVDVGGKKWVVSCERHATLVGASSLRDARFIANHPEEFCDACRETACLTCGRPNTRNETQADGRVINVCDACECVREI